jgi:hypothetical protein
MLEEHKVKSYHSRIGECGSFDRMFTRLVMDPVAGQFAKTIPPKAINTGDVVIGVFSGLLCGVLAVFVLAWIQGGIAEFDPHGLLNNLWAVVRQIYHKI